ncbi:MAG: VanZ family protein [Anaerolineales bacterium]|nr:VanZ family protein [Anaerolineales bacterium]
MMKWIAILFGFFIITIIVLADNDMLGILGVINRIPYGDKAGHFILYGVLTFLIDLPLFGTLQHLSRRLIVLRVALILGLLIGIEEFSQQFFPSRTFDLVDLTFSYLGVGFFSWLALRIKL